MVLKSAFDAQLAKLEQLLNNAAATGDPARELFKNGARTPLFMLEALGRLASEAYKEKSFEKMTLRFKAAEDAIGAIDYYDAAASELTKQPTVPSHAVIYLRAKANESVAAFESLLQTEGWLDGSRVARIRKRLCKTEWKSTSRELALIEKTYAGAIARITKLYGVKNLELTELETEVHELRRRLRWLSIYPQALGGAVQMSADSVSDPRLATYLTPEVLASPYNKFPPTPAGSLLALIVSRSDFFALSWMIAELGRLKDEGLMLVALGHALEMTESLPPAIATEKAIACIGTRPVWEILKTAETLTVEYFELGSLARLVRGVGPPPVNL